MMASRGMGAVAPSKMPKGVTKARRDDTDFQEYKKGGRVKKMRDGGETVQIVDTSKGPPGPAKYVTTDQGIPMYDTIPGSGANRFIGETQSRAGAGQGNRGVSAKKKGGRIKGKKK